MNYKRKLDQNRASQSPKKSFAEIFSIVTIFSTLFGYTALISYTLPLGFLPIVSLESLPILLIGFFILITFLLVCVLLIWLPIGLTFSSALKGNRAVTTFQESCFLVCKQLGNFNVFILTLSLTASLVFWYVLALIMGESVYIAAAFLFSLMLLGVILNKYNSFIVLILILSFSYSVFLSLETADIGRILNLVLWSFMALTVLIMFSYKKKKNRFIYIVLGFISLVFYALISPVVLLSDSKDEYVPNFLVQSSLQLSHLGGGLPVRILSPQKGDTTFGMLLFYDGHKAWVKECGYRGTKHYNNVTAPNGVITEIVVSKITYFETGYDICFREE